MQVFSEPEITQIGPSPPTLDRRDSYETSQMGDNTYATIQPRNTSQLGEVADYATLRNNSRAPSVNRFMQLYAFCSFNGHFVCADLRIHWIHISSTITKQRRKLCGGTDMKNEK